MIQDMIRILWVFLTQPTLLALAVGAILGTLLILILKKAN